MSTTEFPAPGPGAGINSQIEINRAQPVILRNSRFLVGVTLCGSLVAAIFAVCMLLMVVSLVFLSGGFNADIGWSAFRWAVGALAMSYMCPRLWIPGRAMAGYRVVLDGRGVNFNLGTNKKPSDLFLTWDQVSAIKQRRVGNAQQFWVVGTDGSEARFSSYTFFRPKKVARMIAARTGLAIQKA
jgi:hypothetical protein